MGFLNHSIRNCISECKKNAEHYNFTMPKSTNPKLKQYFGAYKAQNLKCTELMFLVKSVMKKYIFIQIG